MNSRQLARARALPIVIAIALVPTLLLAACATSEPQPIAKSIAVTLYAPTATATALPIFLRSDLPTFTPGPTVPALPTAVVVATDTPEPTAIPSTATEIPPTLAPTETAAPDVGIEAQRGQLLALHNQLRATLGLDDYTTSENLQQAAQQQADWLASQPSDTLANADKNGHRGENGTTFAQRISRTGYRARSSGENWTTAAQAAAAFDFWANNPDHSPSIFSSKFTDIGIGITQHSDGSFVYVVVYAKPR